MLFEEFMGASPGRDGADRLEDDLKQSSLLQFEGSRLEAQVVYTRMSLKAKLSSFLSNVLTVKLQSAT